MNMYKYILETQYSGNGTFFVAGIPYTDIHVASMELVVFHETSETYVIRVIEADQKSVHDCLSERKKRIMTTRIK
jgi:hypothetical protein